MKRIFTYVVISCFAISLADIRPLIADGAHCPELKGIEIGMNKRQLLDNWGSPSKREHRNRTDIWFYLNENTPDPIDGIIVYIGAGKVSRWKLTDNIYADMSIWGAAPGHPETKGDTPHNHFSHK